MPTLRILKGRVVTMTGAVVDNARLCLADDRIEAVVAPGQALPAGFGQVQAVDTGGVIYPGLIDLHNHLPYNILAGWHVPLPFENRKIWRGNAFYKRDISIPMGKLLPKNKPQPLAASIVRYVEAKALLGGTTTHQGMSTTITGGTTLYRGIVRNVEVPEDAGQPAAGGSIDYVDEIGAATLAQRLGSGKPYFVHLAEGVEGTARNEFDFLEQHTLAKPNLVCIHCLDLTAADHQQLFAQGARCVWSPLSNLMLYGKTIAPADLPPRFALGCDWAPSGSKNLLQELKVAWMAGQQGGHAPGFEALAHAVTIWAAQAVQWGSTLGSLEAGKLADLLVLDARQADPYENLVRATEREIRAVLIDGLPRLGDHALMPALNPTAPLERIAVGGRDKSLALRDAGAPLQALSLTAARDKLVAAMSNLDQPVHDLLAPLSLFADAATPELSIELDMQAEDDGPATPFDLAFAPLPPLTRVPLDPLTVIDDAGYWQAFDNQANLPAWLKGPNGLRSFYA